MAGLGKGKGIGGLVIGSLLLLRMCDPGVCGKAFKGCNIGSSARYVDDMPYVPKSADELGEGARYADNMDDFIRAAEDGSFRRIESADLETKVGDWVEEVDFASDLLDAIEEEEVPEELEPIEDTPHALDLYALQTGQKVPNHYAVYYSRKTGQNFDAPSNVYDGYVLIDFEKRAISTTQSLVIGETNEELIDSLVGSYAGKKLVVKNATPEIMEQLGKSGIRFFMDFNILARHGLMARRYFRPIFLRQGSITRQTTHNFRIKHSREIESVHQLRATLLQAEEDGLYPVVIYDNHKKDLRPSIAQELSHSSHLVISCHSARISNLQAPWETSDYLYLPYMLKALKKVQNNLLKTSPVEFLSNFSKAYQNELNVLGAKEKTVTVGLISSGAGVASMAIFITDEKEQ
ncbi:MAG: hypothetical protein AAFR61_15595 [Bacteroidota bacterium]